VPAFRDLRAWQLAKSLSVECTKAACGFPGGERHPLAEQLLRACYSVPLNIAEGSGRKGAREFRRFLDIARGSLVEVQSAIEVARELGYLTAESYARLDSVASETGRTLWGLLRNVSDRARRR
jgi:four helix bundle protein